MRDLQKALFKYFEHKIESADVETILVRVGDGRVTVREGAEVTLHNTSW